MSDVTMQCLASLATGKALRTIDELCESQSRVGTWKLSTLVATARSELGECAFQLRKSHDALETECSRVTGENARLYDQIVELHLQCDQLRAERDSHQRLCIAEMEKSAKLRAELEGERENAKEWLTEHYALQAERDQLRAELAEYQEDPSYVSACETIRKLRAELEAIRGQPSAALIEAVRDLIGAANSVNRSRMHEVRGHDDDQPRYWQRKEWVDWLVENGEKAQQALGALPPQQPDAVSVPRELLRRLLDSNNRNTFCAGTYLKAHDELSALLSTKNAE